MSTSARWRRFRKPMGWPKRTMGLRELTGSRSRPSKKAEWRVSFSRFETNWSQTRIDPCEHGRRRYRRTGARRSASSRFPRSAIVWSREHSSSSWNRSSKLISNRGRMDIDRNGQRMKRYTRVQYARFADDMVILIDSHPQHVWLARAVEKRLREELVKLKVEINEEKSKIVDLANGGSFTFLGFEYRRILGRNRKWRAYYAPKLKKRTALVAKLKEIFRQNVSQPVEGVIEQINPILRGWVNYFALGDSSECFSFVRDWVEKKIRGHLMRARERSGLGWKRWSRKWLYRKLGLYSNYRLRRPWSLPKSQVAEPVT